MINADLRDFRKLPNKREIEVRKEVVIRHRHGETVPSLAAAFHGGVRTILRWLHLYAFGGFAALGNKLRKERRCLLNEEQMLWILETVRDKTPLQMKFPFIFQTLKIIRETVRNRFDIKLGVTTAWRVMQRLDLTFQRPKCRAYQQDSAAVKAWKERDYPKLVERAKEADALIVFADEAGMRSDYHVGTTWAERGKTSVVRVTGSRFRLNMLTAISPEGRICYRVHEGTETAGTFRNFLQEIADNAAGRTIYAVVDRVSIHTAKEVARWRQGKDVELHFLPTYSPELNPAELVRSLVKQGVGKEFVRTQSELLERLLAAFKALQVAPRKVQQLFREADCACTVS